MTKKKTLTDKEKRKLAIKYLLKLAKANDFPCVAAEYSGEGDSGYITDVKVFTEGFDAADFWVAYDKEDKKKTKKLHSSPFPKDFPEELKYSIWTKEDSANLSTAFENAFHRIPPESYEVNSGGQGVIVVNAEEGVVTIEHGSNYTEVTYKREKFTPEELNTSE